LGFSKSAVDKEVQNRIFFRSELTKFNFFIDFSSRKRKSN